MSNLTFSIPEEIKVKITAEKNYSSIISTLIEKYLNKGEDPIILKQKLTALTNEYNSKFDEINYQIEVIEKQNQEAINEKQEAIDKEKRIEEGVAKRIAEMKHNENKPTFQDPDN
jgi:hypothetical protein|tara:strand:+ start:170 stop:514 length:345 start_codon:yes stop_codon:yes gene_type:complete